MYPKDPLSQAFANRRRTGFEFNDDTSGLEGVAARGRQDMQDAYTRAEAQVTSAAPARPRAKIAYNPDTKEFMVAGQIIPRRLEVLQELVEIDESRLPDMDELPGGFLPVDQGVVRGEVQNIAPEGNFWGRAGAGAKSSLGLMAASVDSMFGNDDPSNSWSRELQDQWQDESYSEQAAAQRPWYSSFGSFSSGAGEGLGQVGAIAVPAIVAGVATGGSGTPLVVAGTLGAGAAYGEQATESYATSIEALLEKDDTARRAESPLYAKLRDEGLNPDEAMRQTAIEGARMAGLPAAGLGALESVLATRYVGGRFSRLLGGGQGGKAPSLLERMAKPGGQRSLGGTAAAAGIRSVLGGTASGVEEVAETSLGQAAGAATTGIGSTDPMAYASWQEFEKAFQTGAILGPFGGRSNTAANNVPSVEDTIANSDIAQGLGSPQTTDLESGSLQATLRKALQELQARFGDAPEEAVMADPRGRELLGFVMGAQRQLTQQGSSLEQYLTRQPGLTQPTQEGTPTPGAQPSLFGGASLRDQPPAPRPPQPQGDQYLLQRAQQLEQAIQSGELAPEMQEMYAAELGDIELLLARAASEQNQQGLFAQQGPSQSDIGQALAAGAGAPQAAPSVPPVGPAPRGPLIAQRLRERAQPPVQPETPLALPPGDPVMAGLPPEAQQAAAEVQQLEAQLEQLQAAAEQRVGANWQSNPGFARTQMGRAMLADYLRLNEAIQQRLQVLQPILAQLPAGTQPGLTAPQEDVAQYPLGGGPRSPAPQAPPQAPAQAAPEGGRPMGVAPAPLPNPEPMSPGEAASRRQTAAERGAPIAPAATAPRAPAAPEGVSETTPEPAGDIAAQLQAMMDPESTKDAVWVPKGSPAPKTAPKGAQRVETPQGVLFTTNATKAKQARQGKLTDAKLAKILQYPEAKADVIASGAPVVVQAKDKAGNDIASAGASAPKAAATVAAVKKQAPKAAAVTVTTPQAAQADRAQRAKAEKAKPTTIDEVEFNRYVDDLEFALTTNDRTEIRAAREEIRQNLDLSDLSEAAIRSEMRRIEAAAAQRTSQPAAGAKGRAVKAKAKRKPKATSDDERTPAAPPATEIPAEPAKDEEVAQAEADVLELVEAEHPQWVKTYGKPGVSPLVSMPVTRSERARFEDGFIALVAREAKLIASGDWSFKGSVLRRVVQSITDAGVLLTETSLRGMIRELSTATEAQIMQLLGKENIARNIGDSLVVKSMVRGPAVIKAMNDPTVVTEGRSQIIVSDMLGASAGSIAVDTSVSTEPVAKEGIVQLLDKRFEGLGTVLTEWAEMLDVGVSSLQLMTPQQAVAIWGEGGKARRMGKEAIAMGENSYGKFILALDDNGNMTVAIALNPDLPKGQQLEALAHEFGHVVENYIVEGLPSDQKQALLDAHERWSKSVGEDVGEAIASSWPALVGLDQTRKLAGGKAKFEPYYTSFSEWLANNIGRFMLTDEKPRSAVEKVFAKVAAALRKIYDSLVGRQVYPDNAVADFLREHIRVAERARGRRRPSVPTVEKTAAMEGVEVRSAPPDPLLTREGRRAAKAALVVEPVRDAARSLLSGDRGGARASAAKAASALTKFAPRDWFNKAVFMVSTLRDIKARSKGWGDFGRGVAQWVDLQFEVQKLANVARREGEDALEKANKLSAPERVKLQRLMQNATIHKMHPDKPLSHKDHKHLRTKDEQLQTAYEAQHGRLAADWADLRPETQAAYKALLSAPQNLYREMIIAKQENIRNNDKLSAGAKEEALAQLKNLEKEMLQGPYFPLMRTGNYIVSAHIPSIPVFDENGDMFKTRKEADARAARVRAENPHATVSVDGGDGEFTVNVIEKAVYFFPTLADAEAALPAIQKEVRDAIEGLGIDADAMQTLLEDEPVVSNVFKSSEYFSKEMSVPSKFLNEIRALHAAGKMDSTTFRALEDMYIQSLPEMSHSKTALTRQNIRGASEDMLDAYARRLVGASHQLAVVQRASQVEKAWDTMRKHRRDDPLYSDVMDRLQKGQELVAQRVAQTGFNRVANIVTDLSSMFSLAFSPAYVVMNAMQPLMVSLPVMAGLTKASGESVGLADAMKALQTAYAGAPSFFGAKGVKDFVAEFKKMAGKGSETQDSMEQAIIAQFADTPDKRALLRDLLSRGTLDFDFLNSLHDAMGGPLENRFWRPLQRMGMALPQQVESMNRVVTALAVFDLATTQMGMPKNSSETYQFVDTIVARTQMDYSRVNRPALFNMPVVSITMQFKMYLQGMYSLMVEQTARAVSQRQPGETEAQFAARRKQGMLTLSYLMATHAAIGGAIGLGPVYEVASAAAALAASPFTEDDDWLTKDQFIEKMLRDAAADVLGEGEAARLSVDVLTRGLPALVGVDVSERMGLPLVLDSRFSGVRDTDNAGTVMDKTLLFMLGAPYSTTKRVVNGVEAGLNGDVDGAVKGLPASLRSFVGAARQVSGGIVDKDGDVIMKPEDINPFETLVAASGFQTADTSRMYRQRSAEQGTIARIRAERTALLKKYRNADPADRGALREELREFNARVPRPFRLMPDSLRQSVSGKRDREADKVGKDVKAVRELL